MQRIYPAYVNSLYLKDEIGNALTLDEEGNGTFKEYVLKTVLRSAQKELDKEGQCTAKTEKKTSLISDEKVTAWLTIENGKAVKADFNKFVEYRTRLKATPAFDSISASSWENELFGTEEILGRHFSQFGYEHSTVNGDLAEKEQIKMMNPMYYVDDGKADKAKHFRIRHGNVDRDTTLAISNLFAVKLQNAGIDVSLEHPWGIPHAGDYDLDELFAWIDGVCSVQ